MIIYRKDPIPAIYSAIPFLRRTFAAFVDCQEDYAHIEMLKDIVQGNASLSAIEDIAYLLFAVDFPDDILTLKGQSNELYQYPLYFWKLYDVTYYVKHTEPAEAISYCKAGLDNSKSSQLASVQSCVTLLRELEKSVGVAKGTYLSASEERLIVEEEERLSAKKTLQQLKNPGQPKTPSSRRKSGNRATSVKIRNAILQRDHYQCIFCGATSNHDTLEVNHIIPRSLIEKLELNPQLYTAEYNLVTTCFPCNRGKSDTLSCEDTNFYMQKFAQADHPNHKLMEYLQLVKALQNVSIS